MLYIYKNLYLYLNIWPSLLLKEPLCDARKAVAKARAWSKKKFVTKLNNLKGKNPKLYWKLLQGNKKDSINVPLEAFKKHFEELSVEAADTNSNNPFPEFVVRDLNTSSLNQPFSE